MHWLLIDCEEECLVIEGLNSSWQEEFPSASIGMDRRDAVHTYALLGNAEID